MRATKATEVSILRVPVSQRARVCARWNQNEVIVSLQNAKQWIERRYKRLIKNPRPRARRRKWDFNAADGGTFSTLLHTQEAPRGKKLTLHRCVRTFSSLSALLLGECIFCVSQCRAALWQRRVSDYASFMGRASLSYSPAKGLGVVRRRQQSARASTHSFALAAFARCKFTTPICAN